MEFLIKLLIFIEVALIILFPNVGVKGGTAYYTPLLLVFIVLCYFINKRKHFLQKSKVGKNAFSAVRNFIILTLIGIVMCIFTSSNVIIDIHQIVATCIWAVYVYIFFTLSSVKEYRSIIKLTLFISSIILGIYSLYSYITETDLYKDIFGRFLVNSEVETHMVDSTDTRGLKVRVLGNVGNPVFFSGELMMFLIFIGHLLLRAEKPILKFIYALTTIILLIGCFCTGSKSGLLPSLAIFAYIWYKFLGTRKFIICTAIATIFVTTSITIVNELLEMDITRLFISFDIRREDTGGSNLSMRTKQFGAMLDCVGYNFFFGNGYGWCYTIAWLPVLLSFESIIMVAYIDGGIWGLFVYILLAIKLWKVGIDSKRSPLYHPMLLCFYFFCITTGIGAIKYFFIILGVILAEYESEKRKEERRFYSKSLI